MDENLNSQNLFKLLQQKEKELERVKQELEKTREDLDDLEIYIEDLFSFLPLPVCTLNTFGIIVNVNQAFLKLTKYDIFEVVGQYFQKLFLEEKEIEKIIENLPQQEVVENKEAILITKEKKMVKVSLNFGARKNIEGIFVGAFVAISDISELKRFQNELEMMVKERTLELEEKISELEKFTKIAIGRELRIVDLKKKIKLLEEELKKYKNEKI